MSKKVEETRKRILDSTVELLEDGNPAAVRMADIARRAGITRQALYLHFSTRAELLIAAVQYVDTRYDVDALLAPSREATDGLERLDLFIEAWGNFLPRVRGIIRGLLAVYETDDAAAAAWDNRRQAVRHGCEAAVAALNRDGRLSMSPKDATDTLWGLVSFELWDFWTTSSGWSDKKCLDQIKHIARAAITRS